MKNILLACSLLLLCLLNACEDGPPVLPGLIKSKIALITIPDLLGNEVKTLINEERYAGEYSVEFDGSNLSSGVYFYRLASGNFSETKKLLLLK